LDIGCKFRPYEENCHAKYVGLDMPSEIFKTDTKKPDIYGNGETLPFSDNSFDLITTYSVVPYVKNIDKFFNEIYRVLKPSGTVVVIIMNLRGLALQPKTKFENRYNSRQLNKKLNQHGFSSILEKNPKAFFFSKYFDLSSVYAYAVVRKKKPKNQIKHNFGSRMYFKSKLSAHSTLYSLSRNLHRKYCKATHFLHSKPTYLIIGAAKCGTSSLHEYLMQNPCVGRVLTKQLHFYDLYYNRGMAWYKVCLPFVWEKFYVKNILKKNYATGEATAHYLNHPTSPKRVAETLPNVKIIVMLRNPIDRAYSHYQMEFNNGNEELSFEDAIDIEPDRINGEIEKIATDETYLSKNYPHRAYLNGSMYAEQLKRWFEYFPKEQFHFVKTEDFNENPSRIYNDVLKFLDLPNYELSEYKKFRERKYEKMNPETRSKLSSFFKSYNEELYSLTGIDFKWKD
jgi:ubiquinone/menaquinone biosynthesis C-methylase UbiE